MTDRYIWNQACGFNAAESARLTRTFSNPGPAKITYAAREGA